MKESTVSRSEGGFVFRDLNKNGRLDVYEDARQPVEARVKDLMGQMTLAEKAGLLFINGAIVNADGSIEEKPGEPVPPIHNVLAQMGGQLMTHFNLWAIPSAEALAAWNNNLQRFAESTRLGIPVTLASDPRNHFTHNIFAMAATDFTQWCE
ncbi:MAG: glycoside hydrolase family 3 protein, partial [Anaerolineae bacterium]|nr:glycoside hydrolase family 3 protein [Anaerolineae bacterium]